MNVRKVIVISGGAKGIGRVLVNRFAAVEGYSVSACDTLFDSPSAASSKTTATTTATTPEPETNVHYYKADVSAESDVKAFIEATLERFGRIDCLINNAAIANPYLDYNAFEDIDMTEFQRAIQVNLVGPVLLAKYCARHLRESKGSVINISSTRATMSEPKCEAYAASKGGIESLTHALAISLQGDGIRVNAVAPGWIHVSDEYTPTDQDKSFHPVGRIGNGDDIFEICHFLSDSAKSGFITGQTITVDGGVTKKMIYPE